MSIFLEQVCPLPLLDHPQIAKSDVWMGKCTFRKGQRYLIKAPSGRGKSSFMHLLYGLRRDYEGQISIDDAEVSKMGSEELAALRKAKLSIVFQDLRLFPQLTGLENIIIKNDLTKHKTLDEIRGMAAKLNIVDILEQTPPTLSYGQQQRIALIRALCQPFDYLLLDEPFSHIDEANIQQARGLIDQELKKSGAGLIIVSLGSDYNFKVDYTLQL